MRYLTQLMKWLTFRKADRFPLWLRVIRFVGIWPTLHYCMEWDGLVIDNSCPEWGENKDKCICGYKP